MNKSSLEGLYNQRLGQLIEDAKAALVGGKIPSYEDFREMRGVIRGYEKALYEFNELMKQYKEFNDQ